MSYHNQPVPVITYPVMLDEAIESVQADLANMVWMEKMFARAWDNLRHEKVQGSIERLANVFSYPSTYIGNGEYYDLLPNDNFKSYGFFKVEGNGEFLDYDPNTAGNVILYNVSAIFWFNLDKIYKALSDDTRFTQILVSDILAILEMSDPVNEIISVLDDTEEIFAGYSIRDDERQMLRHPYGAIKVNMKLLTRTVCYDVVQPSSGTLALDVEGSLIDPLTGQAP